MKCELKKFMVKKAKNNDISGIEPRTSKGRNKISNISTTQALSRETVKVKIDLLLMLDASILFLPFVTNKNKTYFFGTERFREK